MPRSIKNATNVIVLGALLYREIAVSALGIVPRRWRRLAARA